MELLKRAAELVGDASAFKEFILEHKSKLAPIINMTFYLSNNSVRSLLYSCLSMHPCNDNAIFLLKEFGNHIDPNSPCPLLTPMSLCALYGNWENGLALVEHPNFDLKTWLSTVGGGQYSCGFPHLSEMILAIADPVSKEEAKAILDQKQERSNDRICESHFLKEYMANPEAVHKKLKLIHRGPQMAARLFCLCLWSENKFYSIA